MKRQIICGTSLATLAALLAMGDFSSLVTAETTVKGANGEQWVICHDFTASDAGNDLLDAAEDTAGVHVFYPANDSYGATSDLLAGWRNQFFDATASSWAEAE